jgi:hypothetical protein
VRLGLAVLSTTQSFVLTVELFEHLQIFVKRFFRIWIGPILWVDNTMGIEDIMLGKAAPQLANELNCYTCSMQANTEINEEIGLRTQQSKRSTYNFCNHSRDMNGDEDLSMHSALTLLRIPANKARLTGYQSCTAQNCSPHKQIQAVPPP